jgi:hypothetical protein
MKRAGIEELLLEGWTLFFDLSIVPCTDSITVSTIRSTF